MRTHRRLPIAARRLRECVKPAGIPGTVRADSQAAQLVDSTLRNGLAAQISAVGLGMTVLRYVERPMCLIYQGPSQDAPVRGPRFRILYRHPTSPSIQTRESAHRPHTLGPPRRRANSCVDEVRQATSARVPGRYTAQAGRLPDARRQMPGQHKPSCTYVCYVVCMSSSMFQPADLGRTTLRYVRNGRWALTTARGPGVQVHGGMYLPTYMHTSNRMPTCTSVFGE